MQLFPEEGQQEQTAEEGTAGRRGSRAEEKNGSGWGGGGAWDFVALGRLSSHSTLVTTMVPVSLANHVLRRSHIHENHCCSTPLYRL